MRHPERVPSGTQALKPFRSYGPGGRSKAGRVALPSGQGEGKRYVAPTSDFEGWHCAPSPVPPPDSFVLY